METKSNGHLFKFLFGIVLAAVMLCLGLGMSGSQDALAQTAATPKPNEHYSVNTITLSDGTVVEQDIINGPPVPPPGFEVERRAVALPEPNGLAGINTLTVPAYTWVFGCSAVSGAMIAAYYDRIGFPNIYSGPTNSGVMPMDNSSWPTWSDGIDTYPNLPLAASKNGVDGRSTPGSIDDYWVLYGSTAPDPYVSGAWTQHTWGEAIGDYMKTSQSAFGNSDGATSFFTYTSSSAQFTCREMETRTYGGKYVSTLDGTYGRKLFYEARGYGVADCYNQKTDNNAGGFTYAMFKAEIDAGWPVMLNLAGHTVVGIGYDDTTSTVYIHDTWDYSDHSMTWGGSYSGMALQSVSIVKPALLTVIKAGTGSGTVTSDPPGIDCGSTCGYFLDYNTVVTLTAVPAYQSTFDGWSGAGCSGTGTCTLTLDAVKSVTATFTLNKFTLSVNKIGTGSGTVTSSPPGIDCGSTCSYAFGFNTAVTLTATSTPPSTFLGWSGNGCSGRGTCTVTMDATKSVSANFSLTAYWAYLPLVHRDLPPGNRLSAGSRYTCALTLAGGIKCWGTNYFGELGDGTSIDKPIPVDVVGLTSGVSTISAGGYHTCALMKTGGVKCWGDNNDGELGDGTTTKRTTPVDVTGLASGVIAISAGENHTCALMETGRVKCWGDNLYGQLGDLTTTDRHTPVDVIGLSSGVSAIGAGRIHTCALMQTGGVKCWGYNSYGQLGDGTTTNRTMPVDVVGLASGVSAIRAGENHTCALTQAGGVKCWGYNGFSQLGDGTTTNRLTPVDVTGLASGMSTIGAGDYHTCALMKTGGVKCWGNNGDGQLGDGTTTTRRTPVDVAGLTSEMSAISVGGVHTCALAPAGGIKCWGDNYNGQLGDGTTTDRNMPVDVIGFP